MKRELAIIGAGYVGVPLAQVFAEAGVGTVLVDIDPARVEQLRQGESYIEDVPSDRLAPLVESGALTATTDYDAVRETDAVLIAVPTPLTRNREPDLSIVFAVAAQARGATPQGSPDRARIHHLSRARRGRSVLPILAGSGLEVGKDFFLAFSPERVDPGREDWTTKTTPKVLGGVTQACTATGHRPVQPRDRHDRPGVVAGRSRAGQAAREHLPLGQHRARQRAGAAVRPHGSRRLGGDRGSRDEALRLHALRARAGARRALPSRRPVLPVVEGARVRLLHGVHRARREGQREHAVLLPRQDRPRAQRGGASAAREPGPPRGCRRTRRTSATRASRRR